MAPYFVVEGTHRLALQVQVEIDVELAITPGIAPNRRRRRFCPTAGVAEKTDHMRLIEPDQPVEAPHLSGRCRVWQWLNRSLLRQSAALSRCRWREIGDDGRALRRLARRRRGQRYRRFRLTRCNGWGRRRHPNIARREREAHGDGDCQRRMWWSNHVHGLCHLTLAQCPLALSKLAMVMVNLTLTAQSV